MVAGWTLGQEPTPPPSRRLLSRTHTVVELAWHVQLVHGSGRNLAPNSNVFLPMWQLLLLLLLMADGGDDGTISLRTPWQTGQQAPG